jgi:hypothetical protein
MFRPAGGGDAPEVPEPEDGDAQGIAHLNYIIQVIQSFQAFTEENEGNKELLVLLSSKAKAKPAWKFGTSQHQSLCFLGYLL